MSDMRRLLAVLFSVAFVGAFPILFYKAIPTQNEQLITYMLGQLSGVVLTIVAFHFSSTAGGEAKTKALAEAARTGGPGHTETMEVDAEQVNIRGKP